MSVDRIEEARHTSCELYLFNDMVLIVKQGKPPVAVSAPLYLKSLVVTEAEVWHCEGKSVSSA